MRMRAKRLLLATLIIGVCIAALVLALVRARDVGAFASASETRRQRQPVIVELFTSEGCSSCPPADALLLNLRDKQPVPQAQIIVLEEHVDYWDHQDWADPYDSFAWTERQERYSKHFSGDGVYTPQMIVDGETEFVGSREWQAVHSIATAAQAPKAQINLSKGADGTNLQVRIQSIPWKDEQAAEIWLAITESKLESKVTGGENRGERLVHSDVLRSMQKVGRVDRVAQGQMPFETSIPWAPKTSWNAANLRAVVFLQDPKTLRVLGAAQMQP